MESTQFTWITFYLKNIKNNDFQVSFIFEVQSIFGIVRLTSRGHSKINCRRLSYFRIFSSREIENLTSVRPQLIDPMVYSYKSQKLMKIQNKNYKLFLISPLVFLSILLLSKGLPKLRVNKVLRCFITLIVIPLPIAYKCL